MQHSRAPVHQHHRCLAKPPSSKIEDQKPLPRGRLRQELHRSGVHGGCCFCALETARQILSDRGETGSLPVVRVPPMWPRVLMVLARILLIPVVAVARVIAWLEEKLSPHRPEASNVRRKATPRLLMDTRPPRKR